MAWDFRFGKTGGADSLAESPLLPPLQRMIAHVQVCVRGKKKEER